MKRRKRNEKDLVICNSTVRKKIYQSFSFPHTPERFYFFKRATVFNGPEGNQIGNQRVGKFELTYAKCK
jgi:hypothetical protein